MSQVLDATRASIEAQIAELEPVVRDYEALIKIREALPTANGNSAPQTRSRKPKAEAQANGDGETTPRKRGPRGPRKGAISARLEEIAAKHPQGIEVKRAAERLKTAPTYLYTVVGKSERLRIENGKLMLAAAADSAGDGDQDTHGD